MSGHNAERTLPPGDRDDAPPSPPNASLAEPVAGREAAPAVGGGGLLPGLTLEIEQLGTSIDELQMTLGDLKLGKTQGDWALIEASAHRAAGLARHIEHTITATRPRRTPAQQAAE